ncbi:hypothetical protein HGM15179_019036 [Zosterops borbonicus]|uniref:Uncharacterized protein n=1 Tax=Zosterops borbonicus TaxID=364589 RepID=A0A8K1DBZ4_9PASS|nr:hypothetical protein HGM15179_019036 [Zosterops borbonicus]
MEGTEGGREGQRGVAEGIGGDKGTVGTAEISREGTKETPGCHEFPPPLLFPPQLLEALVAVVATLGQLAATVAGPYGDMLLSKSPRSLHMALWTFIDHLRHTLNHPRVTPLGQALAALGATSGATWANVRNAARDWQDSVAALRDSWEQLAGEATKLRDACGDVATAEATTAATATAQAGDLVELDTHWKTARNNLVATAWQPLVAPAKDKAPSLLAEHKAWMAAASNKVVAATKAMEESVVATSQAGAATRRRQWAEMAWGPLERLVAACDTARAFPQELLLRLGDMEAALEGTKEASADVPKALVAAVGEAERLWEASARLATCHLLGTLGDIRKLLSSHPSGPGGRVVAERCQRAIEDIPRLLRGQ